MVNRRMFRPGFPDAKDVGSSRPQLANGGAIPNKKPAPPESTHAENFYWVKQMQSHTPMAVVLENGEVLKGHRGVVRQGLHQADSHRQPQSAGFQAGNQIRL